MLAEDPLLQYDFEGSAGEKEEDGKGEEEERVGDAGKPDDVEWKDEGALLQRCWFSPDSSKNYCVLHSRSPLPPPPPPSFMIPSPSLLH